MPDRYLGKYTGIVKDNRDTQTLGRVRVSVPTLFPEDELMDARAALPYGFFFVPENEAKVWIEFEGGDPGLPIWSGIQFTPGDWPGEADADPPRKRVVRTAAGHLLAFHDEGGAEKVEIRDGANGHLVVLDAQGISIEDGVNAHRITLGAQGIAVEGGNGIGTVTIGPSGVKVETNALVEVKGSLVKLGDGTSLVARMGDSGVGNLGAPVVLTVVTNMKVMA